MGATLGGVTTTLGVEMGATLGGVTTTLGVEVGATLGGITTTLGVEVGATLGGVTTTLGVEVGATVGVSANVEDSTMGVVTDAGATMTSVLLARIGATTAVSEFVITGDDVVTAGVDVTVTVLQLVTGACIWPSVI